VQKWGCGGINVDGCRVPLNGDKPRVANTEESKTNTYGWAVGGGLYKSGTMPETGRFPANLIHDGSDEVLTCFPQSKGQLAKVGPENGNKDSVNVFGDYGPRQDFEPRGDSGSAARFFKTCSYTEQDTLLCNAKTKYIDDILVVCNQELVNTVDDNSHLSNQHAVSVLNRVVTEASQGANRLRSMTGLSMNVTPMLLKHLCENAIDLILNTDEKYLQGLYPIGTVKLNENLAKYAETPKQIGTMMTIQSPTNLDGYAVVAMSITTNNNMDLGGRDCLPRFKFCTKASKSERGFGNTHPTVKPLALMEYLCKLITPPNGIVLDPFVGSGSTAIACGNSGFNYIGIDSDLSSVKIAMTRLGMIP
jgi:hypothetical protein